jgi:nucleoside-diphosphate-sugar epimerase
LAAEKAGPGVQHFHHKALIEDYMRQQDVPFVALRPGAFLDQADDFLGSGVVKRGDSYCFSIWDATVPIGMIVTSDLARLFADAVDLPEDANGKCIDVGWSRPMAFQEIVSIVATKLNRSVSCYTVPWLLRLGVMYTLGWLKPLIYDTISMCNWFSQGLYVNDPEQQRKYFGEPPTPEDAIGRYVDKLLQEKAKEEEANTAAAAAAAASTAATAPAESSS